MPPLDSLSSRSKPLNNLTIGVKPFDLPRDGLYNRRVLFTGEELSLKDILQTAWQRWQIIAHINGDYVARFVVNAFYFTIMIPFALGARLFTDPLQLRNIPQAHWKERKAVGASLDEARSQF